MINKNKNVYVNALTQDMRNIKYSLVRSFEELISRLIWIGYCKWIKRYNGNKKTLSPFIIEILFHWNVVAAPLTFRIQITDYNDYLAKICYTKRWEKWNDYLYCWNDYLYKRTMPNRTKQKICATKRAVTNGTILNDAHVKVNHRMINYPSLSNIIAAWGHISLIWSIDSKRGSRKFHYTYMYTLCTHEVRYSYGDEKKVRPVYNRI